MIYAIKNNKVNRAIYKANEDALTSSIFERLSYLPKELMHHIIQEALYDMIPGLELYNVESIEYWPNWSAKHTTNKNRIEPDIFIRTSTQDVIIKAKRYDYKQQSGDQWEREIQNYNNEYSEDHKELVFIALGGLHSQKIALVNVNNKDYKIYKCKWIGILKAVKNVQYNLDLSKQYLNSTIAIDNILSDIILCFELFGFSSSDWLESMPSKINIRTSSINFLSHKWIK